MIYNILAILIGLIVFVVLNFILAFYRPTEKSDDIKTQVYLPDDRVLHNSDDVKYILLWSENSNDKNGGIWQIHGETLNENYFKDIQCPEHRCIVTKDKSMKKEYDFDAILFHGMEFNNYTKFPMLRSPHQVYILGMTEAPPTDFKLISNHIIFNMTS